MNEFALSNVETTAPPPAAATDVAFTVQSDADVWSIDTSAEMLVTSKSVPIVVDNPEQSSGSFPVTLNEIAATTAVEDETERVTVGEVSSTVSVPVDAADRTPRTSFEYALYVPSSSPVAERFVSVAAVEIVT